MSQIPKFHALAMARDGIKSDGRSRIMSAVFDRQWADLRHPKPSQDHNPKEPQK